MKSLKLNLEDLESDIEQHYKSKLESGQWSIGGVEGLDENIIDKALENHMEVPNALIQAIELSKKLSNVKERVQEMEEHLKSSKKLISESI